MRTLRLDRETLSELGPDELARLAGGGPPALPTRNGCPWTGDPCLFTGTPITYHTCG